MIRKIGIIGCGTIGSELALAIDSGKVENASLIALFDILNINAIQLKSKLQNSNPSVFSDFLEFVSSTSFLQADIIVEAASQEAVRNFSKKLLDGGKNLLIMSVGALSDYEFLSELIRSASKNFGYIYLPTGAIAGIDAIRSVKDLLESVTLTTTKTPKALADAPFFKVNNINPNKISKKTLLYDGDAANAVNNFPANINVAAILSLAGLGIKKTSVKIIADPEIEVNQHEILAKGVFGEIMIKVRNVPSTRNPKTSFLAVLSAIECLRSACNNQMRIGT